MKHFYKHFRTSDGLDCVLATISILLLIFLMSILSFNSGVKQKTCQELESSVIYLNQATSTQILPKTGIVEGYVLTGIASYYDYSLPGEKPGEEWSKSHDTCATRGWNRYGKLKVTNLDNNKSVECYVNDDGPRDCAYRYKYKLDLPGECVERLIDLSSHAFRQIADTKLGLINVTVEEVGFSKIIK